MSAQQQHIAPKTLTSSSFTSSFDGSYTFGASYFAPLPLSVFCFLSNLITSELYKFLYLKTFRYFFLYGIEISVLEDKFSSFHLFTPFPLFHPFNYLRSFLVLRILAHFFPLISPLFHLPV